MFKHLVEGHTRRIEAVREDQRPLNGSGFEIKGPTSTYFSLFSVFKRHSEKRIAERLHNETFGL